MGERFREAGPTPVRFCLIGVSGWRPNALPCIDMSATTTPIQTPQLLLGHHLKALRLPTMLREYDRVARQCAAKDIDYPRYLLRIAELELLDRTPRRRLHLALSITRRGFITKACLANLRDNTCIVSPGCLMGIACSAALVYGVALEFPGHIGSRRPQRSRPPFSGRPFCGLDHRSTISHQRLPRRSADLQSGELSHLRRAPAGKYDHNIQVALFKQNSLPGTSGHRSSFHARYISSALRCETSSAHRPGGCHVVGGRRLDWVGCARCE